MSKTIKVWVEDFHDLYREALIDLLRYHGFAVVGASRSKTEIIATIGFSELPDIAIINYKTNRPESLDTAIWLKETYPSIKIVINTLFNHGTPLDKFRQIGIEGLMIKSDADPKEILKILHLVHDGERIYSK